MRILVTGASGFVGSSLVPRLKSGGHDVSVMGRNDVAARRLVGVDTVVHLANIAHARVARDLLWRVNVAGTRALAEQAAEAKVRRFIYVSSIKASGERTRGRAFDGSENPEPEDEYGRTKLAAERALADVAARTGLETVVLRPPLIYGPGVKANFLALIRAIDAAVPLPFAGIHNRRSLLYVGNLVDAIARCVEFRGHPGRLYVLSDGFPVSTPELCRALAHALSRRARLFSVPTGLLSAVPRLRPLVGDLEVNDSAIRAELSWTAPFSLADGLQATARWYRDR